MMGRVQDAKPTARPEQCRKWLNDRVRQAIDWRPMWSDLLKRDIISIPQPFNAGTVSPTYQSNRIVGVGTGWPVNDVVNTTLQNNISALGNQRCTPNSMNGITPDTLLLIDGGTFTQEVVSVVEVGQASFIANFKFTHNGSQTNPTPATITSSSLAQLQMRMASYQPIFTVMGVVDPQTILVDNAWGGPSATLLQYQILKMYCTMPSDFKDFVSVTDPVQGIPLGFHYSQKTLDYRDPQRTASGEPIFLVDSTPNSNGNMQYEIWPPGSAARQIRYMYVAQWPEMKRPTDRPPYFINPVVFVNGAIATALRTKVARDDWAYDPVNAKSFEQDFIRGLDDAANADESKCVRNYTTMMDQELGFNSEWMKSHSLEALWGDF